MKTRKIPHRAIKFETGEGNRIVYESLYRPAFRGVCENTWNLLKLKLANLQRLEIEDFCKL